METGGWKRGVVGVQRGATRRGDGWTAPWSAHQTPCWGGGCRGGGPPPPARRLFMRAADCSRGGGSSRAHAAPPWGGESPPASTTGRRRAARANRRLWPSVCPPPAAPSPRSPSTLADADKKCAGAAPSPNGAAASPAGAAFALAPREEGRRGRRQRTGKRRLVTCTRGNRAAPSAGGGQGAHAPRHSVEEGQPGDIGWDTRPPVGRVGPTMAAANPAGCRVRPARARPPRPLAAAVPRAGRRPRCGGIAARACGGVACTDGGASRRSGDPSWRAPHRPRGGGGAAPSVASVAGKRNTCGAGRDQMSLAWLPPGKGQKKKNV